MVSYCFGISIYWNKLYKWKIIKCKWLRYLFVRNCGFKVNRSCIVECLEQCIIFHGLPVGSRVCLVGLGLRWDAGLVVTDPTLPAVELTADSDQTIGWAFPWSRGPKSGVKEGKPWNILPVYNGWASHKAISQMLNIYSQIQICYLSHNKLVWLIWNE